MKIFLLFFTFSFFYPDLSACRKLMDAALNDQKKADQFYTELKDVSSADEPVMLGFRAMSEFMQSKHIMNPISRLSHFKKGKILLEDAIQRDQTSPELLFFRLSTQSNVPSILHYSSNIASDKQQLIHYLKQPKPADRELHQRVKSYLLINPHCSAAEKNLIKTL